MSYQVDIQSQELEALFDIRGVGKSMKTLMDSVKLPLPDSPNSMINEGQVDVMRLGPKRCLVRAPLKREITLEAEFRINSNELFANATCISDMYYAIRLQGADVLQVLRQVTPLNLYKFKVGAATATDIFALAGFLVREYDSVYTVYVESSYADYVLERLQKCALVPDV